MRKNYTLSVASFFLYVISLFILLPSSWAVSDPEIIMQNASPEPGLIGEEVCLELTFGNIGSSVGYQPYIRIAVPIDYIVLDASFGGGALTYPAQFSNSSSAVEPYFLDPISTLNTTTTADDTIVGVPLGYSFYVIPVPLASMNPADAPIEVELCIQMGTGVTPGSISNINIQGAFGFGDDPFGTGPITTGNVINHQIEAFAYTFEKTAEYENVVSNSCDELTYYIDFDLADGLTYGFGNYTIEDLLPLTINYVPSSLQVPAGCVITTLPSPGIPFKVDCDAAIIGNNPIHIEYEVTTPGALYPLNCNSNTITNAATIILPDASTDATSVDVDVEEVSIRPEVSSYSTIPGDLLEYNMEVVVTDGGQGIDNVSLDIDIPDGMEVDVNSFNWGGTPISLSLITYSGTVGPTTITVDLSAANASSLTGCLIDELSFEADVLDFYSNAEPVKGGDILDCAFHMDYDLLDGGGNTIATCTGKQANLEVEVIESKIVLYVSNSPPNGSVWQVGDIVEYTMNMSLPSGSARHLIVDQILPIPAHDVTDITGFGPGLEVEFINNPQAVPTPTLNIDPVSNSFTLDFGLGTINYNVSVDIDISFYMEVKDVPLSYDLNDNHISTVMMFDDNGTTLDLLDYGRAAIQVGVPDLEILKEIADSDNPFSVGTISFDQQEIFEVEGGDFIDFEIYTFNSGSGVAHDITIVDTFPDIFDGNCIINFAAVYDAGGFPVTTYTAADFTFTPNSFFITIDSLDVDESFFIDCSCEIREDIPIGGDFYNGAYTEYYPSSGASLPYPIEADTVALYIAGADSELEIVDIFPGNSGVLDEVHIGEIVYYEFRTVLPSGAINEAEIKDSLLDHMSFIQIEDIYVAPSNLVDNIVSTNGTWASIQNTANSSGFYDIGALQTDKRRYFKMDFGDIICYNSDYIPDTLVVEYSAIVLNSGNNDNGISLEHEFTTASLDPNTGTTRTYTFPTTLLEIIEPSIVVTKDITQSSLDLGDSGFMTIEIENTSDAAAFDVVLNDLFPAGMSIPSPTPAPTLVAGPPYDNITNTGGEVTLEWDFLEPGDRVELQFQIDIDSFASCPSLTNCARAEWQSIWSLDVPTQRALSVLPASGTNPIFGIERSGDNGLTGPGATQLNAYNDHRDISCDIVQIDFGIPPIMTTSGDSCEGGNLSLSVPYLAGASYSWDAPIGLTYSTFGLGGEVINFNSTAAADGRFTVEITTQGGCVVGVYYDLSVDQGPGPVSIEVNGAVSATTQLCEGDDLDLDVIHGGSALPFSYSWSTGAANGFTSSLATPTPITNLGVSDGGTYLVQVTDNNGCTAFNSVEVIVSSIPPPNNTALMLPPICEGQDLMLGLPSNPPNVINYHLISPIGNTYILPANSPMLTIVLGDADYVNGAWQVAVESSIVLGCLSPYVTMTSLAQITEPTPGAVSASPILTPVCPDGTVDLSITTAPLAGYDYTWAWNDVGISPLGSGASIMVLAPANDTMAYILMTDTGSGCIYAIDSVLVPVHPAPSPPIISGPSPIDLCEGDQLTLTSNISGANAYSWEFLGASVSTSATLDIPSVTLFDAGDYTLSVIDPNGCSSPFSLPVTVNVFNGSTGITTFGINATSPVCAGDSINLELVGLSGVPPPSNRILWVAPDGQDTITNLMMAPLSGHMISIPPSSPLYQSGLWEAIIFQQPPGPTSCPPTPVGGGTNTVNIDIIPEAGDLSLLSNNPVCVSVTGDASINVQILDPLLDATLHNWFWDSTGTLPVTSGGNVTVSGTANNLTIDILGLPPTTTDTTLYLITGGSSGCVLAIDTVDIQFINVIPTPTYTSTNPVCENDTWFVEITNYDPNYTYTWNIYGGNPPMGASINLTDSTLEIYSVLPIYSAANGVNYDLNITHPTCGSAGSSFILDVNEAPQIGGNIGTICNGDSLSMWVTDLGGAFIDSTYWVSPLGWDTTVLGSSITVPPSSNLYAAGTWGITAISPLGCISTTTGFTATINSSPAAPALVATSPICEGDDATVSITNVNASYTYDRIDNSLGSVLETITPPTSSFATMVGLVADTTVYVQTYDPNTGCLSAANFVDIIVDPKPALPTVTSSSATYCVGDVINLYSTTSAGLDHLWTDGGTLTTTAVNPTITATTPGVYVYYLQVSDPITGCTSDVASITITVYNVPAPPSFTSNSPVCDGDPIELTHNSGGAPVQYYWIDPLGDTTVTSTGILTINDGDSNYVAGNFSLLIEEATGCVSPVSSPVNVTFQTAPNITIFNNPAICSGDVATLNATQVAGYEYQWYTDPGLTNNVYVGSTPIYTTFSLTIPTTFYLVVQDTFTNCQFYIGNVFVDILALPPTPQFSASVYNFCEGEPIDLLSTSTGYPTYLWTLPNATTRTTSTPNVTITNAANPGDAGTYFVAVIGANGCGSDGSSATVNVTSLPAAPTIASITAVCTGDSAILSTGNSIPAGYSVNWYKGPLSNNLVAVTSGPDYILPSVTLADAGIYRATYEYLGCEGPLSNLVTLQVDTIPNNIAFAGADQFLCDDSTTTLVGIPLLGNTGTWTTNSGATISVPPLLGGTANISNLPIGTSEFYWTLSNGACVDYSADTVIVDVSPSSPDNAFAGADIDICDTNVVVLSADIPTLSSGVWTQPASQINAGVIFADSTDPNTSVFGLVPGNSYTFTWTLSYQNCVNYSTDDVVVYVEAIPVSNAFAGSDIYVCDNTGSPGSFVLNASAAPTGSQGYWELGAFAVGLNVVTPNSPTSLLAGTFPQDTAILYWVLETPICGEYSRDSIDVAVYSQPAFIANAGFYPDLCDEDSLTLNGNIGDGQGVWTISTSGGTIPTIDDPNSATANLGGLTLGQTYDVTWTWSDGSCIDYTTSTATFSVLDPPPVAAFATDSITICDGDSTSLQGFLSAGVTGNWTALNGGTILNFTDPNSVVLGLPIGTHQFVWSLSDLGGVCVDYDSDTTTVVVENPVLGVTYAGLDQTICTDEANLYASPITALGVTGTWSQPVAQQVLGITISNVNTIDPLISNLITPGVYEFYWSASTTNCLDYETDTVYITVVAPPTALPLTGSDQLLCNTDSTQLQGNTPPVGTTGIWSTASGATILDPNNPTTFVENIPSGTHEFVWTYNDPICGDYAADTVLITIYGGASAVANAGVDTVLCGDNLITLTGNIPASGTVTGQWNLISTNTPTPSIASPSSQSTQVSGLQGGQTYLFTWTLSDGPCPNYDTDTIEIINTNIPNINAYAGLDQQLCNATSVTLDATPVPANANVLGTWTALNSGIVLSPNDPVSSVVSLNAGANLFEWSLSDTAGFCAGFSADTVEVLISTTQDIAYAGLNQVICSDSITLFGDSTLSPTTVGTWTQSPAQAGAGVNIFTIGNLGAQITGMQGGNSYTFYWELSSPSCGIFDIDSVVITVNPIPTENAYAGEDTVLCSNNSVNLSALAPTQGQGTWFTNSGALIADNADPNTLVSNLPIGSSQFIWKLSTAACGTYSEDTVNVVVLTVNGQGTYAGADIYICDETEINLDAEAANIGQGLWTQSTAQTGQGVQIVTPIDSQTLVTNLQAGNTYTFVWSLSVGNCNAYATDTVDVIVDAIPNDVAYAGDDLLFCSSSDSLVLAADVPLVAEGEWFTSSGAIILSPTTAITDVINLDNGVNTFIWTLSNGACVDYDSDTIFITSADIPVANDDSLVLVYNQAGIENINLDVTVNDILPNTQDIFTTLTSPDQGIFTDLGDGNYVLDLTNVIQSQTFTYSWCNPLCADDYCDTAEVQIIIDGGLECNVPNMFTPNGNGENDTFIIPCLTNYPGTKFTVFNRWGDKVYESSDYQNDWDGTYNGKPVPDGAYFYIIETLEGQAYQGFVEVRR